MIRPQTCPICDRELAADAGSESDVFPFCSDRCRQIDFQRWWSGRYAIIEPLDPSQLDGTEEFAADTDTGEEEWQ